MANPKPAGKLKIFDPALAEAASAVMEAPIRPQPAPAAVSHEPVTQPGARNRKAGGRNVRISGYIPPELEATLRDEVIRRTVAEHRTVSFNDVLCDALESWKRSQEALR